MRRIDPFDLVTTAAVAMIGAGVCGRWGWPEALMVVGTLVLAVALIEASILRGRG